MESPKPCASQNPLLSLSTFLHQQCLRLGSDLSRRLDDTRRLAGTLAANFPPPPPPQPARRLLRSLSTPPPPPPPPFASLAQAKAASAPASGVARTLAGTAVYTVSNSNNEFVLVSDPDGTKSIGLLCFRQEDAESFLAQVRLRRRELKDQARVVPITLDQVYMLKVEGIAFRFLPDPVQIKNALEMKATNTKNGFDGVPVFQSDLLVVKKKNRRFCPIYFRKEDIEKELSMVSRASRGAVLSQQIMEIAFVEEALDGLDLDQILSGGILVGSLEDVLRKMEMSEKNSGWEDLIFIPPGKSHSQHIQEVVKS